MQRQNKSGWSAWVAPVAIPFACAGLLSLSLADDTPKVATKSESVGAVNSQHPLMPALTLAKESQKALESVKDYSVTFHKKERIKNGTIRQTMEMKFRKEPFSVYLNFTKGAAGREVIFVAGKNDGKLVVHEDGLKGLAGTLTFAPNAEMVMKENRYPITEIGMHALVEKTIDAWQREMQYGETEVKVTPERFGDVDCMQVEVVHPKQRQHFAFHRVVMHFDVKTRLPVHIEQYGFPQRAKDKPQLLEEYTYENIKTNVGFADVDFDPKNKDYKY